MKLLFTILFLIAAIIALNRVAYSQIIPVNQGGYVTYYRVVQTENGPQLQPIDNPYMYLPGGGLGGSSGLPGLPGGGFGGGGGGGGGGGRRR